MCECDYRASRIRVLEVKPPSRRAPLQLAESGEYRTPQYGRTDTTASFRREGKGMDARNPRVSGAHASFVQDYSCIFNQISNSGSGRSATVLRYPHLGRT